MVKIGLVNVTAEGQIDLPVVEQPEHFFLTEKPVTDPQNGVILCHGVMGNKDPGAAFFFPAPGCRLSGIFLVKKSPGTKQIGGPAGVDQIKIHIRQLQTAGKI